MGLSVLDPNISRPYAQVRVSLLIVAILAALGYRCLPSESKLKTERYHQFIVSEPQEPTEKSERDKELEDTFPASDPPSRGR